MPPRCKEKMKKIKKFKNHATSGIKSKNDRYPKTKKNNLKGSKIPKQKEETFKKTFEPLNPPPQKNMNRISFLDNIKRFFFQTI